MYTQLQNEKFGILSFRDKEAVKIIFQDNMGQYFSIQF